MSRRNALCRKPPIGKSKKPVATVADRGISYSFRKFANFAGTTEATRRSPPRAIYLPAGSFSVGQTAPGRQVTGSLHRSSPNLKSLRVTLDKCPTNLWSFIAVVSVSKSRCFRLPSHVEHRGKVHPRNLSALRQLSSPGARFGRRPSCSRQSRTTPRSRRSSG